MVLAFDPLESVEALVVRVFQILVRMTVGSLQVYCLNFLDYLDLEETTSSNEEELIRDRLPYANLIELGQ